MPEYRSRILCTDSGSRSSPRAVESTTSAKTTVVGRRARTGSRGGGTDRSAGSRSSVAGGLELRVVREHPALELAQLCARLEAELVGEQRARLAVDLERLRLAAAVEGEHQLRPQPLAERVLGDERSELGNELALAAAAEVGLEPVLQHLQPHLLEPLGLAAERLRGQAGQRGPRQSASASCNSSAARSQSPAARAARPSAAICSNCEIEPVSIQHERVAAGPTLDRARPWT